MNEEMKQMLCGLLWGKVEKREGFSEEVMQ